MNVSNRKCIRRLSIESMKAAKARNWIAIFAIALTTILFTSLFTVVLSINHSFQEANFRQVGGRSHGSFKYMTREQFEELKTDPLIRQYGLRRFVGMPMEAPFLKAHVEIGYSDANQARWMFCNPVEGSLPEEGTKEAATDTRVLELLGVEPVLGEKFTIAFYIDGKGVSETFTLSGWWEYDEAIPASHILIPHSRAQEIYDGVGIGDGMGKDGLIASWNMDIMFASALHIEADIASVLNNHGYQTEERGEENYIAAGVNWGYTGTRFVQSMDPITMAVVVLLLLIIIFTGYLIIYNVFQISVSNDIRFYGLLKTIGTTGRQIRRIIRLQALCLSSFGIPLGLLIGYGVGVGLTPVIMNQLNGVEKESVSANPVIFLGSGIFALVTVIISCRRPGRMASRVSPMEAVRYTEGKTGGAAGKKHGRKSGASLFQMAWANIGRNKGKTAITIISLSLSVLLLNLTVTFTGGFDMDKYLSNMVSDFLLADAGYFHTGNRLGNNEKLTDEVISLLESESGVEAGGRTYQQITPMEEFVTEEYYRKRMGRWNSEETLDAIVADKQKNEEGLLADFVQTYGMEEYIIDKLQVLEGDISKLKEPGSRYVAAVYKENDYGSPIMDSHWARVGDKVTLRYVEEYEAYDPNTGEILEGDIIPDDQPFTLRAKKYRERDYEVAALVAIPQTLSYRFYGSDEFVMNDQTFITDSGTSTILYYGCDVNDENMEEMETLLSDLTKHRMPHLDYESKETYAAEFDSFKNMFLLLGGVLSFITGLVGVLNYLNVILTGIVTRRHEFAVLQSIGMTGKQLKTMLIWEGLCYALGAMAVSLVFNFLTLLLLPEALENIFWFFTYRFTMLPILFVTPVFITLGIAVPIMVYHTVSGHSIVERLRESE